MSDIIDQIRTATDRFIRAYAEYKNFRDLPDDYKIEARGNQIFEELALSVKEVERLRSEYDTQIEFNEAQMLVHDFCLRIDTDEKGNMGLNELHSISKEWPSLLANLDSDFSRKTVPSLIGITKGSTILLGDFKVIDGDMVSSGINLNRVKNIVDKAVTMVGKSDTDVLAESNRFARENDLSDEQVYTLVKGLTKITSGNSPVAEISFSNSHSYNEPISLKKNQWKKNNDHFKKELDKINHVEPPLYIEGQVRSVEAWEETHAFRLYNNDKPSGYNIHFNPEHFRNSEIAELMDNYVTIHRTKIGRLWFLDEIVSINKK